MNKERFVEAVNAMKAIGVGGKQLKPVLLNLLELFEFNWEPIEAENYSVLREAYLNFDEKQGLEHNNECTLRQDRPAQPFKKLHLEKHESHVSSPLAKSSKRLALKDAAMPLTTSGQGSKKPSQPCLTDRRTGSCSDVRSQVSCKRKKPISSDLAHRGRISMHNGESGTVHLEQPLDKPASSRSSTENFDKPKPEHSISGVAHHFEPISPVFPARPGLSGSLTDKHLKKSQSPLHEHSVSKVDALGCNGTNSSNNFCIASSTIGDVKVLLDFTRALNKPNFQSPNFDAVMKLLEFGYLIADNTEPQFSLKKLLENLCETFLELGNKPSSNPNLISPEAVTLAKQASKLGNLQRDMNKKSLISSRCLNSSNQATSEQQSVTCYLKRSSGSITDISKGSENVQIPLLDETCNGDLPKFTYIPHNIIYQNAYVQISLARISEEDCCSNCSGDCLSSSIPCACARETGGEFAYTQQGLLKEEFLIACLSMKKAPCEKHFVYCQDCPLERSKNEYFPEKCKGHIVRKFIKECWRKCGCSMQCRNRIVQQGITCKLQVFLTRGSKGWGLRTLQDLPKGTFVCEYVGEILTNTELYERNMQSSGNERHTYPVTLDADWGSERVLRDEEALCLDATFCGNVARFINHRCFDASLIDIPVEVETPDRHYYHLAFFTTRDVIASEELTWDYGIDFSDHDHPVKAFKCSCGSQFCRDAKQTVNQKVSAVKQKVSVPHL